MESAYVIDLADLHTSARLVPEAFDARWKVSATKASASSGKDVPMPIDFFWHHDLAQNGQKF
jgi:hypothetical protein